MTGQRDRSPSTASRTGIGTDAMLRIDTDTPNPARIYDWLLGGKDHFPADRVAADALLKLAPQARESATENRTFLGRVVRFLVGEAGIRQFLDIGTGIPTSPNVHQIAQQLAPEARVVYVDNDPIVHVHANALLADNGTAAVLADLRKPEQLLGDPAVGKLIDFDQPVGLLLVAVLHFVADQDDPAGIVARLRDTMVPGSYVAVSHATADFHPEVEAEVTAIYQQTSAPLVLRSRDQIARLFDGFELVTPGLVQPADWHAGNEGPVSLGTGAFYGGVGRRN